MTRGETGRASAGPRDRTLDRDEILGRRASLLQQPPSSERSAALQAIRNKLIAISRRVG